MSDVKAQIQETVDNNEVVLYMKGTKEMPQCGFSSRVAGVLNYMGVDYQDVNVLSDETIRQGIKDFSDGTCHSSTLKANLSGAVTLLRK